MRAQPAVAAADDAPARPGSGAGFVRFGLILGAVLLVCGLGYYAFGTVHGASGSAAAAGLMPDSELPNSIDEGVDQSATLEDRYPNDPRVRVLRAIHFFRVHDLADAETQLRTALDQFQAMPDLEGGEFVPVARLSLALTLLAEGKPDAAKTVAAPACDAYPSMSMMGEAQRILRARNICD